MLIEWSVIQQAVGAEEPEVELRLFEEREFWFSSEFYLYFLVILAHPFYEMSLLEIR